MGATDEYIEKYPEHVKLQRIQPASQIIGEFLEWATSQGMQLAQYQSVEWSADPQMMPVGRFTDVIARYFEIDQDKIEIEKRTMLDEIRAAQA